MSLLYTLYFAILARASRHLLLVTLLIPPVVTLGPIFGQVNANAWSGFVIGGCDHGWTSFQDTQIEPKLSRQEACGTAMHMPQ